MKSSRRVPYYCILLILEFEFTLVLRVCETHGHGYGSRTCTHLGVFGHVMARVSCGCLLFNIKGQGRLEGHVHVPGASLPLPERIRSAAAPPPTDTGSRDAYRTPIGRAHWISGYSS
jgi:hypothetical protein